eukprot:TRINITY_DN31290_c0_g1_i1.p1 TRINITY_DN31290_c0_g1~~TRINITY_DN31290_c0_g1_i1.p1  ORF type:complete len:423 (-),score=209.23 TRINITY_DN31290_c0_g1_i1:61-1155(-)
MAAIRAQLKNGQEEDDVVVYRFLRGYKFDVDAAARALDKSIKFRKEMGCAAIREKAKDMHMREFPFADRMLAGHPHNIHHKFDKRGQPLSIERIGHSDPGLLTKLLTLEEIEQYHLYHIENKAALVKRLTEERGEIVRNCKVMDLSGLGVNALHREGIAYLQHLIKISQDNYPEMLGNLYIINAPWIFSSVWRVVSAWLNPATIEKINILGSNYMEVLLEHIDADSLPDYLGGTCTDCKEHGGCCPLLDPDHDMEDTPVAARGKATREVKVEIDKSQGKRMLVSWEFRTVSNDIGFSVWFMPEGGSDSDKVTIVKPERVNSHKKNVVGTYAADKNGMLVLEWDNSFSRWTSKTVKCRVQTAMQP